MQNSDLKQLLKSNESLASTDFNSKICTGERSDKTKCKNWPLLKLSLLFLSFFALHKSFRWAVNQKMRANIKYHHCPQKGVQCVLLSMCFQCN